MYWMLYWGTMVYSNELRRLFFILILQCYLTYWAVVILYLAAHTHIRDADLWSPVEIKRVKIRKRKCASSIWQSLQLHQKFGSLSFLTCSDIWSLQNQDEGNCDEFENSGIQKPPFRFPHWGPPWPLHGRAPRTVHKTRATSAYLKITSLLQSQMCSICSKQP